MPPTTGVASGCMISTPVRWSQKIGVREAMVVATVMTLGRSRSRAPALTASISSSRVSSRPRPLRLATHRLLQVGDHDDAGLDGGAEERDVADPDRDAEVEAHPGLEQDPAGQGEGHREQHMGRLPHRAEGHHQGREDDEDDGGEDVEQGLPGPQLVLVLAGVLDGHARVQGHLRGDALLDLVDEAAQVPVADIGLDEDPQPPVLALDLVGTDHAPDVRHLAQLHRRPRRG